MKVKESHDTLREGAVGRTGTGLLVGLFFFLGIMALVLFLRQQHVAGPPLPVLGQVTGFTLTNQAGQPWSSSSLEGRIWVADIIFTRCPGSCVVMTSHLRQLQQTLPESSEVSLVSLTADPAHDTPEVLRAYANRFEADPGRWQFLTGPQSEIYKVATGQLLLAVAENPDPDNAPIEDLFLHSTKLVLVDRQGRLRGVFDGTDPSVVEEIRVAVSRLEREPLGPEAGI